MKLRLLALVALFTNLIFAQSFHDTQGKLEISSGGQAMYTLPIAMPPSIADVGPVINLIYASGQPSGIAGQGWSINSISTIARMATRQDIDGFKDGVDFDDNDKLALDGQRLLLKSGSYWADGSIYETEVQSNTKIELKKNGTAIYFIVTTPDGSRTWYGNYGGMDATDATAFYVVRFEDANGNFMNYVYGKPQNKALCVTEIQFSGNTITNPTTLNKIVFTYDPLTRKENAFVKGIKVEKAEILRKIEVYTNNQLFKRYVLTHLTDAQGYQRVSQIQEFNGALEAANPVQFEYNTTNSGATVVTTPYNDSVELDLNEKPDVTGDFDGDGRMDIVDGKNVFSQLFRENNSLIYTLPAYAENSYKFAATTLSNGKLNQKQSIVSVDETLGTTTFKVHNLDNGSFVNSYNKTIDIDNSTQCSDNCTVFEYDIDGNILVGPGYPVSQCQGVVPQKKTSTRYLEGDFNGDGISEVLILSFLELDAYNPDEPSLKVGEVKKGSDQQNRIDQPPGGCQWTRSTSDYPVEVRLVDFNPNTSSVLGSVGNLSIPNGLVLGSGERFVADFNSDGKSDILVINKDKSYKVFGLKQLTSAPWIEFELLGFGTMENYSVQKAKLFGDFNGDGKTDIMMPDADGKGCDSCTTWHIYYSNPNPAGGSLFTKETITNTISYRPYTDNSDYTTQWHRTTYYALDINKDGKSDLVKVWMRLYIPCETCYMDKDTEWRAYGYINNLGYGTNTFTEDYVTPINPVQGDEQNTFPIPIASNFRNGGLESDLIVVREHDAFAKKVYFVDFNKDNSKEILLKKVTQSNGAIVDEIEYKSMVPAEGTNDLGSQNDFYSSTESLYYPLVELKRIPTSLLVSKVTNTSLGVQKLQDYRYHGYALDLSGNGPLGFLKTARSSWYKLGDKKLWNVSEIDPLLRGANKKTYTQLLSTEFTFSDATTNLLTKVEKTYYPPTVDPVTKRYVLLLNKTKNTDILTNVITETVNDSYSTDYFLPTSVTTKNYLGSTLQGTTNVSTDFHPANVGGTGSAYTLGKPKEITKTSTAYGDTKISTDKFTYTGANLTKTEKSVTGSSFVIVEDFVYFNNGLLKDKTVSATGTTSQNAVSPRTTSYTYDATNRFVKTLTDPEGLVTTKNTYHSLYGLVLSETNALGQITTQEYDNWGKNTKITNFLGKNIVYTYTRTGNVYTTTETSDDGSASITENDALSRVIKKGAKDLNGNWIYVSSEYDYLGKQTKVSEPYSTSANLWTAYEYDEYQRPVKVTQPTGKVIATTYSGLTTTVNDEVMAKSKTVNANGHVVATTDTPGGTIQFKYDALGNQIESDYAGIKITTTFDVWGRKTSLNDTSAGLYNYEYNAFGELLKETTPKGNTTYVLNAVGKPVSKTVLGATAAEATNITNTYTYDPTYKWLTRIDVVNPNDGNSSYAYAYDAATKQLKQTIETLPYATFTKNLTFDGFGRVATEETIGVAHGKTSAKTIKHEYKNGAKWKMLDGTTVIWQANTVNTRGQLTGATLGNGITITNTYDQYGFPTQIKHDLGTTNPVNVMTLNNVYDVKRGNLTQRYTSLFDLTEKFEYDTLDRLVTWNGANVNILTLPFNTTTDGFTFNGTSTTGSVSNSAGTLKVVLKNPWVAAQRTLPTGFVSNDIVNVKATITNKTGTSGVIVNAIMVETDPNDANSWAEYYLGPIENGSFDKNYTVNNFVSPNPLLSIKFVVDESSPEGTNGGGMVLPNTTFYVDNFKLEKASVVTQQYDDRGRITQNGTGTYTYSDTAHPYQNTGIKSMSAEDKAYFEARGNLNITYNAFKAPVQIEEVNKDKLSFAYNGMLGRSAMYYGSTATDKLSRPNRRYYSADGSMEINYNNGVVELVTYVGGNAYSAPIVLKSNGTTQNYFYLHRDYQGSIVAVTNATGAIVEKRHFDAWGSIAKVQDGAGNILTKLTFLDRGYTGHEHLQSVGLIHMNGRLYDPKLHRFLQPDNYVQDPYNTQNYNRYGYVLNNPLKYTDPSGEILAPILIGAAVGLGSYFVTAFLNHQPFTFMGAAKATFIGGLSGLVTFGIGEWAQNTITNFYSRAAMQALAHGFFQGSMSGIQGGNFWVGFASGALASIASSAWSGGKTSNAVHTFGGQKVEVLNQVVKGLGGSFAQNSVGTIVFGAIMGGAGASLAKGNFWQGAVTGGIVAGLNHALHQMAYEEDGIDISTLKKSLSEADIKKIMDAYPTADKMSALELYKTIGGDIYKDVLQNGLKKDGTLKSSYKNTCCFRLSKALNDSGFTIAKSDYTLSGENNLNYYFSTKYMGPYLMQTYNFGSSMKNYGLIIQTGCGWSDASGHVDVFYYDRIGIHSYPNCSTTKCSF
ncbi:RHS repeat-associated core domain-containing protein [Flavobacterium sp. GCM10023249]|uniref:RHS repeat-associated core domain-containing protein n=1 Tax=unclassified Flavobacterium TaxID=196869 RepID=UPI00360A07C9